MTARNAVALALAAVAFLAALVAKVMAWNVRAGTVLASVLVGALVLYAAYRLMATGKGAHVAPRGWAEADERLAPLPATIPRAPTEHAPPWQPAPVPVIEPAVIHGPPQVVITATAVGGRVTFVQAAVLPSLHWPAALPPWVAKELGHDSVDATVESAYNRAMALYVRALTDGAS